MARRSPTVRERRLARALRHLREGAGLTIEEVAEKLEISPPPPSRAWRPPRWACGHAISAFSSTSTKSPRPSATSCCRSRANGASSSGGRSTRTCPTSRVAGLEADASTIWQYSSQLVPGLLQTEAYARAVLRGHPARRQAWRHRPAPRAADPSAGAAHVRARSRVLGDPRRGRRAPAGRRADGHGRAARAPDRGRQAAQCHPPGAALHQRRARRDGWRVHLPPLPRVRRTPMWSTSRTPGTICTSRAPR